MGGTLVIRTRMLTMNSNKDQYNHSLFTISGIRLHALHYFSCQLINIGLIYTAYTCLLYKQSSNRFFSVIVHKITVPVAKSTENSESHQVQNRFINHCSWHYCRLML